MTDRSTIEKAATLLKSGKCITIHYKNKVRLLFDATNNGTAAIHSSTQQANNLSILISTDRMANQCIKDIPEVAWDMMDYATSPLILILDGGQFVTKSLINLNGTLAIQMVKDGMLHQILTKVNKPIASIVLNSIDPIKSDFDMHLKQNFAEEKIVQIRLNGEIEILAN